MAANANAEYKLFKYYEGLCSSSDFPKEIAKVLSLGVKSKAVKDLDGNTIEDPFVLRTKNWDIVYPAPDAAFELKDGETPTASAFQDKILNQVSKISDTVILKTRTTERPLTEEEKDYLTVDETANSPYLEMYLEIFKPTYIANPEEYPLDCERSGIVPKVITKELYEEKFKTRRAREFDLYSKLTQAPRDDESLGTVQNLTYDEVDTYVMSIQNICNDPGFAPPQGEQNSTRKEINAADLAKIRKEDVSLYNFILKNLNGGEGIEPKDYTLLEKLIFDISIQSEEVAADGDSQVLYQIMMTATTRLTYFEISANQNFVLPDGHVALEPITPELYLNGVYTPIDTELYTSTTSSVKFIEPFTFESAHDGLLVVRYETAKKEDKLITKRETLLNNHYVLMRLFDNINEECDGPAENVYNSAGDVIQTNSHVSPWSKLSWYQDFEEVMIDQLDEDVSINAISDGTVFVPLETPGLNEDTKIRYWINTNNDRFGLIVMGNPSLDYSRDRHLISACYCGRIDSFENSINDTAGNFALFTSSSTEPCNTTLKTEKSVAEMPDFVLTQEDIDNGSYAGADFDNFVEFILPECITPSNGTDEYWIQLPENTYYSREKWPKYFFADDSTGNIVPITPLTQAYQREFFMEDGKSSLLKLTVEHGDDSGSTGHVFPAGQCKLYVACNYYTEKYAITSGVTRDVFGNVVDVAKEDSYGHNTSDGVTSIMMYHTRSKAYYQKHHMLFATTEEYMSKVMYGKSSYTGEYYADRIKVTHGNDGPRGTLSDLLVIDSASLYALDELVINKDFEKDPDELEETFVYFPISAPYSPLSDSPNSTYGLAIKKQEIEPTYEDEIKILKIAVEQIKTITENSWCPTESNIFPLEATDNGCTVYWKVIDDTAYAIQKNAAGNEVKVPSEYVPVKLAVVNTSAYKGDMSNVIVPSASTILEKGDTVADETYSYLKISGFTANEGEEIMYGIADEPITEFGTGAQIKAVMYDGAIDSGSERWEYNIDGVPFTAVIGEELPSTDVQLIDAAPDKYLVLYSVKVENAATPADASAQADGTNEKHIITKFDCVPLTISSAPKNELLQYPCSINAYIEGGRGSIATTNAPDKEAGDVINMNINYGSTFELVMLPYNENGAGYQVSKVVAEVDGTETEYTEFTEANFGGKPGKSLTIENVKSDVKLKVQFVTA